MNLRPFAGELRLALVAVLCGGLASVASAQFKPGQGVQRAIFQPTAQNEYVNAHNEPVVVPVQYCEGGDPSMGGYGGAGGYCESGYCDAGCGPGMAGQLGGCLDPNMQAAYPPGLGIDQCGPYYFDFAAEYVMLTRDDAFGQDIAFTSLNIDGQRVLGSDTIGDEYDPAFRLTGRFDLGPLSLVEFTYMGMFDAGGGGSFTDPNPQSATIGNLYSLFSAFGTNPAGGVGMNETEQSVRHAVDFDMDLQTAEISYRRYWVGYSPRVSGTLLAGFRYTQLDELFSFTTTGTGSLNYGVDTANRLAGFQCGGDGWVTLRQGIRIGSEGKAGIYNNSYKVASQLRAADGSPNLSQFNRGDNAAFIGEGKAMLVADILPSLSVKGGYEVLYMSSLATAGDNFNPGSPYNVGVTRTAFLADQGSALFHGWHAGIEYVW